MLKQPTFDYKSAYKYLKLFKIEIAVKNIFMTKSYNIQKGERAWVKLNWISQGGLGYVQANKEKGRYIISRGLFELLSERFKPQHNETILSLKYYRLITEQN